MTSVPENQFGHPRVWYPDVESTMDIAASLAAQGAPHGTLVETGFQTAGRGRQGRRWETPLGSALLASWIMRPPAPHDAGVLSPLVALALLRAIRELDPAIPAGYKWPNDIWIGGRKVAGILLSARHGGGEQVVIAGTGINITRSATAPEGSAWLTEWIPDVTRDTMREAFAIELDAMWGRYLASDTLGGDDRTALEAAMIWRGELVEVREARRTVCGTVTGLDPDGSLLLLPEGGEPAILRAGEVVRGPRIPARAGRDGAVYLPEQETG